MFFQTVPPLFAAGEVLLGLSLTMFVGALITTVSENADRIDDNGTGFSVARRGKNPAPAGKFDAGRRQCACWEVQRPRHKVALPVRLVNLT